MPELVNEIRAIELLQSRGVKLSVYTLRGWRSMDRKNQPPYVRQGRRVYYRVDDLERWVATACKQQFVAA